MDCPTCGKTLATKQGMRQHHTKVHGDPLPNRTCKDCQSRFYDPKSRRSYCGDCNPNAGKHNGNWKGGPERTTCATCDTKFTYYPSDKDGIYCSDCIEASDGLLPENPAKQLDRTTVSCQHCGDEIQRLGSQLRDNKRGAFCDLQCYGEWLSANVVGPDHHQWDGGVIDYGPGWWRIRRKALERDEYECQLCGTSKEQLGRNPDVHHKRRVRDYDHPGEAHTLSNVVSLRRSCHRDVETGNADVPNVPTER